jgi:hypothetical protein
MGFRFFRRIKIIPGVTLNLSKLGVSASLGVKGAHVTLGNGKERATVGIPGTGVSYTEQRRSSTSSGLLLVLFVVIALAVWLA